MKNNDKLISDVKRSISGLKKSLKELVETESEMTLRMMNFKEPQNPIFYFSHLSGKDYHIFANNPYIILEIVQRIFNGKYVPEFVVDEKEFSPRMN